MYSVTKHAEVLTGFRKCSSLGLWVGRVCSDRKQRLTNVSFHPVTLIILYVWELF
jgi:hypothetical protein